MCRKTQFKKQARFLIAPLLMMPVLAMAMMPSGYAQDDSGQQINKQDVRTDTPSGYPVPRYVSLKSGKTNCRSGPTLQHPKSFTFQRKGLPVRVIAETTDHWRKIQDRDGDRCWVHSTLLSGNHTALIISEKSVLHAEIDENSRIRAEAEKGVIARVRKCHKDYCLLRVGKIAGWVRKSDIWGYKGPKGT